MTYEEKRAWAYGAVAFVVPVVYFAIVLTRAAATDVADIDYLWLLLAAIAAGIVLNAFAAPARGKADERDAQIYQRGGFVAFIVMSALTVIPLALALAEVPHFWIANSLYLAYVLSAITLSAVRIVAYRRGL